MSEDVKLKLEERSITGKAVKQLRRDGLIPAVIHDHGKASRVVMGNYLEVFKAYKQAGKHHPIEISVGTQNYTAMIKTAEFEPHKHTLNHVVFNAVEANQTVEAEVPVHLTGDIPAEKTGLMVIRQLDHVIIEALPKNLPDELLVDATNLIEIGDHITVADLQVPKGVTIMTEPEHPIATVEETKAQISEEAEAAPEEEISADEVPSEHGTEEPNAEK